MLKPAGPIPFGIRRLGALILALASATGAAQSQEPVTDESARFPSIGAGHLHVRRSVGAGDQHLRLDLGSLPRGLYFIRVASETQESRFSLVVVK